MKNISLVLFLILILAMACTKDTDIIPQYGMRIDHSVVFKKDTFYLEGKASLSQPALIIAGEDIVLDFNGAVILGSKHLERPDLFEGLAIDIQGGENITIKNVVIKGFKMGIKADGIDSLHILDSDLSYHYRPKLKSDRSKEWSDSVAAIVLNDCDHTLIRELKISNGQHGVILKNCNHGLIYNNEITFNSGVGIALHHSSFQQISHNNLDWNIRDFSFKLDHQASTATALLLTGQSEKNEITFNSATHCETACIIKPFQQKDTRDNILYANDLSYSAKYPVEANFTKDNHWYSNKVLGLHKKVALDSFAYLQQKPRADFLNTLSHLPDDTKDAYLGKSILQGRQYMIMDDYGPYNFQYPALFLRKVESQVYTFAIFGPPGNWKAIGGTGFKMMSRKRGAIPATLVLEAIPEEQERSVAIEYIGPGFTDRFGIANKKGKILKLNWAE